MTFADVKFDKEAHFGIRAEVDFPNGYGASIVRSLYSYGGADGLYELAVLKGGHICYDTPITSDVEGHLTEDAVTELLQRIEALPAAVEVNQ